MFYDLNNLGLLQGGSDDESSKNNDYAFDLSDDEEYEVKREKKEPKLSNE